MYPVDIFLQRKSIAIIAYDGSRLVSLSVFYQL